MIDHDAWRAAAHARPSMCVYPQAITTPARQPAQRAAGRPDDLDPYLSEGAPISDAHNATRADVDAARRAEQYLTIAGGRPLDPWQRHAIEWLYGASPTAVTAAFRTTRRR